MIVHERSCQSIDEHHVTDGITFKPCNCALRIQLNKEEAQALVTELGKTFIDRDNPLCNEVLTKLINFVK